jgi:hypothetical protein
MRFLRYVTAAFVLIVGGLVSAFASTTGTSQTVPIPTVPVSVSVDGQPSPSFPNSYQITLTVNGTTQPPISVFDAGLVTSHVHQDVGPVGGGNISVGVWATVPGSSACVLAFGATCLVAVPVDPVQLTNLSGYLVTASACVQSTCLFQSVTVPSPPPPTPLPSPSGLPSPPTCQPASACTGPVITQVCATVLSLADPNLNCTAPLGQQVCQFVQDTSGAGFWDCTQSTLPTPAQIISQVPTLQTYVCRKAPPLCSVP